MRKKHSHNPKFGNGRQKVKYRRLNCYRIKKKTAIITIMRWRRPRPQRWRQLGLASLATIIVEKKFTAVDQQCILSSHSSMSFWKSKPWLKKEMDKNFEWKKKKKVPTQHSTAPHSHSAKRKLCYTAKTTNRGKNSNAGCSNDQHVQCTMYECVLQ